METAILELLTREEKARKNFISPFLTEIGLTPGQGQARILYYLSREDAVSQKELADKCKIDVTTMSRNLDKLESMGLLERKANPACRRSFLICLTEQGHTEAKKTENIFSSLEEKISGYLTDAECRAFEHLLEKICSGLETDAVSRKCPNKIQQNNCEHESG